MIDIEYHKYSFTRINYSYHELSHTLGMNFVIIWSSIWIVLIYTAFHQLIPQK
jgi:hypothetical protein